MTLVIPVLFLCLILVVAGRAQTSERLRTPLTILLLLINIALVIVFGFSSAVRAGQAPFNPTAVGVAILFALAATALLFEPVRRGLARFFPTADANGPGFDPASLPQMTALIYCVYMLASTILPYISAGGLSGLAQDFQAPTFDEILIQLVIFVVVAAFGAGLATRRSLAAVASRLGLRWPTPLELLIGVVMAGVLIVFEFSTGIIWELTTPSDVIQQQTEISRLLSAGVNTLTFALIASAGAAIGEEIAFRGALQPVFGLWPTAIFFALTHIQYTLTPATLLIVGVGLGLGWLRRRYNTTISIIAHFLYDFTLFALPIYLRYLQNVVGATIR